MNLPWGAVLGIGVAIGSLLIACVSLMAKVGQLARIGQAAHEHLISALQTYDSGLTSKAAVYKKHLGRKDRHILTQMAEITRLKTQVEENKNRPFVINFTSDQILKLGILVRGALQDLHESRFGKPN